MPIGSVGRSAPGTCPVCSAGELSTFHVACECAHHSITAARQVALQSLPGLFDMLTELCVGILESIGFDFDNMPDMSALALALPGTLSQQPLPAEAKFLLYWTIAACPWTAAASPGGTLSVGPLPGPPV